MAKSKPADAKRDRKLQIAKEALENNIKRLLRRQVPDAAKNYPGALVKCAGISLTSAKRYVGQNNKDYNFPALDQLIAIAEGFGISVIELLVDVHDAYPAHDDDRPSRSGGGGLN